MPVKIIDNDTCIGCGTCVKTCPMDVLRMDEVSGKSTIAYRDECQICYLCKIYCPVDAITITPEKCHKPLLGWG